MSAEHTTENDAPRVCDSFCSECGDCLDCYGEDDCYDGGGHAAPFSVIPPGKS